MKSFIQVLVFLLTTASICFGQAVQFNALNGPDGAYVSNFSINEQGDIIASQLHVSGSKISSDEGNTWTDAPVNPNPVTLPDSLNNSKLRSHIKDENGIYFATNDDKEIFRSDDQGVSWIYLTKGTWVANITPRLFAPKSNDYIYIIQNRSGNYQEVIYRFKKDGSAFEFVRNTQYNKIYNIFHNPGVGFVFINSASAYFSEDGFTNWTNIAGNVPGFILGGTWVSNGDLTLVSEDGYFRSTDMGVTWTQLPGPRPSGYQGALDIKYDDVNSNYYVRNISSETYNFYRVNNDFTDWQPIAPQNDAPPISKVFVDGQNNIYAAVMLALGAEVEGYHRSTDGGNTFQPLKPNGTDVRSIAKGANDVLFAFGYDDTLYRSTDNGANWVETMPDSISFNPQGQSRFSYVKAHKNGTVIAQFERSLNGRIWLSEDNGINWELIDSRFYRQNKIEIHPDGSIYGAYSASAGTVNLAKYDRQQKTWTDILNVSVNDLFISPTGPIIVRDSRGKWRVSEDNGNSFATTDVGNSLYPTFAPNGYIVAYLTSGIQNVPPKVVLSKNNGISWEVINDGNITGYWRDFYITDDYFIYAAIHGQPIHKSEQVLFEDNFIVGNVFFDKNKTCVFDNDDEYIKDLIVSAEGLDTFYVTTRSDGRFVIPVPAGTYDVKVTVPSPLWEACDSVQTVSLTGINDSTFIDFGIKTVVDCPHLNVDLTNSIMRRCFENEYHVQYCNEGTVTAENAEVEITLDPRFTITTSEIPWSNVVGSIYTFPVGDIDIFECGNFSFKFEMDCDSVGLNETICAEARITPDSICLSPNPNWSGASLQVTGECQGDSMIFVIKNVGMGDMIQARQYIVIEDVAIMRVSPPFTLPAGGSETIAIAALGQTIHVEVPQIEGHPGLSAPSATLEQCGIGPFSTGLFNQSGQNDLGNTVDIECRQVIGAYDPNDKQAVPTGRDEEHFIQPNSTIEYLIRFQNTGTDTAFNVFVLDTISNLLDITTLDIGAGSHDYEFEIYDNGILRFDFKNIMLPDSNVNQLASNGFIKYKIKLKDDAPLGSVIYNAADIYFDFNDPIYTKKTYHTIETPFVTVKTQEVFVKGVKVNVYPNPFSEQATFDLKHSPKGVKQFNLFSLTGKKMHSQIFENQQFLFQRNNLPKGFYFYEIRKGDMKVVAGKLIIE